MSASWECSVRRTRVRNGYALWGCGEAGPAPWSTPGPRLFKLWSGRAIRGGSGRGAEGLPGLSARDAGDERRHSNSRMGFGEAQVPDAANRGLFQPDQGGRLYEGDG